MEHRKKTTKNELLELREELQALRERYKTSEEKRKSLAKQVIQLKEECQLRSDSLESTEKSKLIAEYNLVESKKKLKKLEKKLKSRSGGGRKYHTSLSSSAELSPGAGEVCDGEDKTAQPPLRLMRWTGSRGWPEDGSETYDQLSTRVGALRDLSLESSKQIQAKLSQIEVYREHLKMHGLMEEKKRLVSNVKDEIQKIKEIIRTKSQVPA